MPVPKLRDQQQHAELQETIKATARRHMATEERELLPIGEACLTAADWEEIAHAFQENCDPLTGQQEGAQFLAIFRQIVERTPAPMGLGTRHAP